MILLPVHSYCGMRGYYRWQLINKETGKCRFDTGFFRNKLLSAGMNQMTAFNFMEYCHIGTDATPPTGSDTQLLGLVATASPSNIEYTAYGTQNSAPWFGWKRKTWRFSGAAIENQNLNEAGVGWGTAPSSLISRALVLDPQSQLPTTVVPLPGELLDVTYELRYYPPLIDTYGSVTLNGVNYDTITRAASVADNQWSFYIGDALGVHNNATSDHRAYDGVLGTIEQWPDGLWADPDGQNGLNSSYVNNSYTRVITVPVGTTGWNLAGGIRSVRLRTKAGWYQTQYSANPGGTTIPKDINSTIALAWNLSWGELNTFSTWNMIAASDSTTPSNGEWNTNLAGTLLRIAHLDSTAADQSSSLEATTNTIFRIFESADTSRWIEYTTSGNHSPQSGYTQYTVSQTNINNGGPRSGNLCVIKELHQ